MILNQLFPCTYKITGISIVSWKLYDIVPIFITSDVSARLDRMDSAQQMSIASTMVDNMCQ